MNLRQLWRRGVNLVRRGCVFKTLFRPFKPLIPFEILTHSICIRQYKLTTWQVINATPKQREKNRYK